MAMRFLFVGHGSVYVKDFILQLRETQFCCALFSQDIRQNDGKERRCRSGSPALPQTSWETDHKQVMEGLNFLICECPIGLDGPEVPFRA